MYKVDYRERPAPKMSSVWPSKPCTVTDERNVLSKMSMMYCQRWNVMYCQRWNVLYCQRWNVMYCPRWPLCTVKDERYVLSKMNVVYVLSKMERYVLFEMYNLYIFYCLICTIVHFLLSNMYNCTFYIQFALTTVIRCTFCTGAHVPS